ncbi:MAG: histidine kinase dimerization/phosphoacceptor domain -containing protein [Pseudomonadota bacterium]
MKAGDLTKPYVSTSPTQWLALLDALSMPATIFDRDLVFLGQNTAHEAMTGTRRQDIIGRSMFDAFPPEPGPHAPSAEEAIRASVDRVWSTREAHTLPVQEHALQDETGAWQAYSWKITHAPIIENGAVTAILQTAENVTGEMLQRSLYEAHRLAAQDAAAVSFFSYELASQLFVRSTAVDALFGFAEDEAEPLAAPFFDRIDPDDLPAVQEELSRIASAPLGTPARFDFRVNIPGLDDPKRVRARGAMVIDPADQQQKLVGVFVDMTDFEMARGRLEQAVEDKEHLLVEVNHRVKNSLQLASSILRMEARKTSNPETKDVLANANARVDAIAEVHGGIYVGGDVTRAPIGEVLTNIVDALGRSVGAGDTSAEISCKATEVSLPTDLAVAFGLLVNELLTNALKYGGEPTCAPIDVHTAIDGDVVELTVSNDTAREVDDDRPNGTGIGTTLVKGFVRQLRGEMKAGPDGDRYKVTVTFPLPGKA